MEIEQAIQDAIQHHRAGRLEVAEQRYRHVLARQPNNANALRLLGIVIMQRGDADQAVELINRAIGMEPFACEYHVNLGNALKQQGNFDGAIAAYRRALELLPIYPQAMYNIGVALADQQRWEEAIEAYRQALAMKPDYPVALNNLGAALEKIGRFGEAVAAFRQAIAIKPDYVEAIHNLGHAHAEAGELEDATAAYEQAIRLKPDFIAAHWNLSLNLLLQGDYRRGWAEYEWRWQSEDFTTPRRNFPQPKWNGEALDGRTILLTCEQGFGDVIQFSRYAPMIRGRGGRVILECQPSLVRLMKRAAGVDTVVTADALPPFDLHCPLLSLPGAFDTRLESIPSDVPYIEPEADLCAAWKAKLQESPAAGNLKIGLVWAGRPTHRHDRKRSVPFSRFAPLLGIDGVTFVSLQKGEAAAQAESRPPPMQWIDRTAELTDMADTAALIANLDLVISVDTAVAHLAGALNKPVWILVTAMPDWRWMLMRDDSPWYPSARLFRQKQAGDWAEVIERVVQACRTGCAARRGPVG